MIISFIIVTTVAQASQAQTGFPGRTNTVTYVFKVASNGKLACKENTVEAPNPK